MRLALLAALLPLVLVLAPAASAYPSSWRRAARCIREKESGGRWHVSNPPYGGAYQFMVSTWRAFEPHQWPTRPESASPAQQTLVAWRVWRANGRRWGGRQWPLSSRACGLR